MYDYFENENFVIRWQGQFLNFSFVSFIVATISDDLAVHGHSFSTDYIKFLQIVYWINYAEYKCFRINVCSKYQKIVKLYLNET